MKYPAEPVSVIFITFQVRPQHNSWHFPAIIHFNQDYSEISTWLPITGLCGDGGNHSD